MEKTEMAYLVYLSLVAILAYWIEQPGFLSPNSLIIRKPSGDELDNWLKQFNWGQRANPISLNPLPQYKFYSEIVEVLLSLARKFGGNYQESLLYLRQGLQADKNFEKKINEMRLGLFLQMGLMMALTWAFIFGSLSIVEVNFEKFHLILIFVWQSLGLGALPLLLKFLRKKYFGDIGHLWKILYVLSSLHKVPLSRTEILKIAGVQKLKEIHNNSLAQIVFKLKDLCQKALKLGNNYSEDVNYLMEELRFLEKMHFELFEKRLMVVKLALLSIFFLPSYLAFIFILLGDLMKSM